MAHASPPEPLTPSQWALLCGDNEAAALELASDWQTVQAYRRELALQFEQLRDQQVATEQALAWFESLFSALPIPVLLLDGIGRVIEANHSAIVYLELQDAPHKPLALRRLLRGDGAEMAWINALAQARSSGSACLDEQALHSERERPRLARLSLQRVDNHEAARRGVSFVCTLMDQTEQVHAREAEQAREQAEQRQRDTEARSNARTQMLSRVSHELRTPLNAIMGFSQLLSTDVALLPAAHRPYLGHILNAGRDLLALVDEVLDINRAESGRIALDMVAVSLHDEALAAVHMSQALADSHGITLHVDPSPVAQVRADARRVREILYNLVSNAVKYGHAGGQVWLTTSQDPAQAWIEVRDNGRGMDAQQVAHLFEPFNRLGAEYGPARGHGLGLSICKTYCDAMGGQLEVRSDTGVGSCFRLSLPRWDAVRS